MVAGARFELWKRPLTQYVPEHFRPRAIVGEGCAQEKRNVPRVRRNWLPAVSMVVSTSVPANPPAMAPHTLTSAVRAMRSLR
jgi:hypothetical protein